MSENSIVADATKTVVSAGGHSNRDHGHSRDYDSDFAAIGQRHIVDVARDEGSQTRRFVLEGQRDVMVQVEKIAAASAVQVEKIAAAAQLFAANNHAAATLAAHECCCELKELVRAEAGATRELIRAQHAAELAILLSDAKAEIAALKAVAK